MKNFLELNKSYYWSRLYLGQFCSRSEWNRNSYST